MIAFILTQIDRKEIAEKPSDQINEKLLINGLRNNELSSFNQLYKMYAPNLMGVIMKIVKQQETAEDLLQEVFLKIKKSLNSYDEQKSRLFTWMLNITRNTALDHLRKKSSKQEKVNLIFEEAAAELENHAHSYNTDTIGVKNLLQKLSPKQRHILDLSYFKGYTHEEIAEYMNMPLGSVKTSIRQAILKLRVIFNVD